MKLVTTTTTSLLIAATNAQFYNETSKPFSLVLLSDNSTINGSKLAACHTGAALESLCLSGVGGVSNPDSVPAVTFNFNTTADASTPNATIGTLGILVYTLRTSSIDVPSSVYFHYDPTTDSAIPILTPGSENAQMLAFDDREQLNVQGYIDWTADPPDATATTQAYYRWYACQTYFEGYMYQNLVWGLGAPKPENPTCVSVDVKRVFV